MAEQNSNVDTPDVDAGTTEPTPSVDELIAQLAAERAANERNKASIDKLTKQNGTLTKSLREKQTAEEQEAAAKQEQAEEQAAYIAELENFKKQAEAEKRYSLQGMDAETAAKAAKAEIDGDMDALSQIQKQHTEALMKEAQAQWMKSRPQPQAGNGEYSGMTKEQIMAITDRSKRREAIAQNMDLFNRR